ncbi:uncharacterized [Tachysurus ichikawai]
MWMFKMAVLMFLSDLACIYVGAVKHSVICTSRPDAPAAFTLISMPQSGCGDVGLLGKGQAMLCPMMPLHCSGREMPAVPQMVTDGSGTN